MFLEMSLGIFFMRWKMSFVLVRCLLMVLLFFGKMVFLVQCILNNGFFILGLGLDLIMYMLVLLLNRVEFISLFKWFLFGVWYVIVVILFVIVSILVFLLFLVRFLVILSMDVLLKYLVWYIMICFIVGFRLSSLVRVWLVLGMLMFEVVVKMMWVMLDLWLFYFLMVFWVVLVVSLGIWMIMMLWWMFREGFMYVQMFGLVLSIFFVRNMWCFLMFDLLQMCLNLVFRVFFLL